VNPPHGRAKLLLGRQFTQALPRGQIRELNLPQTPPLVSVTSCKRVREPEDGNHRHP